MASERRAGRARDLARVRRHAVQTVPLSRCEGHLEHAIGGNETRQASGDHGIESDAAAEQGSPREADRHEIGQRGKLRRQCLGGAEDESGVLEPALPRRPGGASRRLDHRCRVGVEAEGEGVGLPAGRGEDRAPVTGAHVDRHPPVAGNDLGELTDVHLMEVPSDDEAKHASQDSR